MRIGYFISHFPYQNMLKGPNSGENYAHGGTEIAAYNLALEMSKRGHTIDVFTTAWNSHYTLEMQHGMNIHRYGTLFKIASANFSGEFIFKKPKEKVDIVHAHFNMPYADYIGMKYSKEESIPFILTYHADAQDKGGKFLRNQLMTFYNRHILHKVLDHADVIIATSKSYISKSKFLKEYQNKIKVIPNGINLKEFQLNFSQEECREKLGLPQDKKIILFFGNIVPYKGPDVLLKAFSLIKSKFPQLMLVFAGEGIMKQELKLKSMDMGLGNHVHFAGFVPNELKPLYYKSADIFCLPSVNLAEAFGIVNLEAMASGIPIIASDLGGIPDIIKNGENGLLFEPGNIKELSQALEYFLQNEDDRLKMGKIGEKKSKNYSWDKIAYETEEIYKKFY